MEQSSSNLRTLIDIEYDGLTQRRGQDKKEHMDRGRDKVRHMERLKKDRQIVSLTKLRQRRTRSPKVVAFAMWSG